MNPLGLEVESLGAWKEPRVLRVTVDGVEVAKTAVTRFRVGHLSDPGQPGRRFLMIEAEEADET